MTFDLYIWRDGSTLNVTLTRSSLNSEGQDHRSKFTVTRGKCC